MVQHVFTWIAQNQVIWGIACTILAWVIAHAAFPSKMTKLGFNISQWIRHLFGAKVEKALEDAIDALDQGLHSDNQ